VSHPKEDVMSFETLLIEQGGGIATVTLNRPPVNALNMKVGEEFGTVMATLEKDLSVRAVIITGSGDRAFAAGADIKEIGELSGSAAESMASEWHRVFKAMSASRLPVIAAINGVALGGGCELAMACDIRLASGAAAFGQPEINLGIIPGFGGTQRLARLVGKGRALEMLMSGESIDAREAHRIGLVNRIVADGEDLVGASIDFARGIVEKGAVALALIKECVYTGMELDLDQGLGYEAGRFGQVCETGDKTEGISAFLEKRKPVFTGK